MSKGFSHTVQFLDHCLFGYTARLETTRNFFLVLAIKFLYLRLNGIGLVPDFARRVLWRGRLEARDRRHMLEPSPVR